MINEIEPIHETLNRSNKPETKRPAAIDQAPQKADYEIEVDTSDIIQLMCKKCLTMHDHTKLKNYYCPDCIKKYPEKCDQCGQPIAKNERSITQGYCFPCHKEWLKAEYKSGESVEIYPNTGV